MIALRESKGTHFFQLDASRVLTMVNNRTPEFRVYVEQPEDGNHGKVVKFPCSGKLDQRGCHAVIKPTENGSLVSIFDRIKPVNSSLSVSQLMRQAPQAKGSVDIFPIAGEVDGNRTETLILSGEFSPQMEEYLAKYGFEQL